MRKMEQESRRINHDGKGGTRSIDGSKEEEVNTEK